MDYSRFTSLEVFIELLRLTKAIKKAYKVRIDLGTTEFDVVDETWFGSSVQWLLGPGTDEFKDQFKNINLFSWGGLKWPARSAAKEIFKSEEFNDLRKPKYPLIGGGHSKGGTEIGAFNELFGMKQCILFAPAPFVRSWKKCKNNYILHTDPDDIVHQAGTFNFDIPKPNLHFKGENDHFGKNLSDHGIDHWIEFYEKKIAKLKGENS